MINLFPLKGRGLSQPLAQLHYKGRRKMTLSELNQHFQLLRKLDAAEEVLQSLQSKIPTGPTTGFLTEEIADMESRVSKLENDVRKSAAPVKRFISSIKNDRTRKLFCFRFLHGLAWCEVSYYVGNCTEQAAKMNCYRYLKKNTVRKTSPVTL